MQFNYKLVVRASLIILVVSTLSLSVIDVKIPTIGNYWTALPKMASFMIKNPQESVNIINNLREDPELFDWFLQHVNEFYKLYTDDKIINMFASNPWLFNFVRRIYSSDPEYFRELTLDTDKTVKLFTWLIDHPEDRQTLYENPSLVRRLIESDYDESFFTSFIKIVFPLPNFVVFDSTPINLTVYSPYNVSEVKVEWNRTQDSGEIAHWESRMGNLSTLWDTSSITSGVYTINAVATIGNGTVMKDSVVVVVYTRGHVRVEILSPKNNQTVSESLSTVAKVSNQSKIDMCYATLEGSNTSYKFSLLGPDEDSLYYGAVNTGVIVDGQYNLTVVALDEDGFWNSSSIQISILDVPQIQIVSPEKNSVLSGNFTISAKITSVDTIMSCRANLTTIGYQYLYDLTDYDRNEYYDTFASTADLHVGNYTLTVTATDIDGSKNSTSILFKIYDPVTVDILSPSDGDVLRGNFTVEARVVSVDSIANCTALLNSSEHSYNYTLTSSGGGIFSKTIGANIFDGNYTLTITATSVDDVVNSTKIDVRVLNTPRLTILFPLNNSEVKDNFNITVSIKSYDKIANCTAELRGSQTYHYNLTYLASSGVYSTVIGSPSVVDGNYTLTVNAVDVDGTTNSSSIRIRISDVPSIFILSPQNGETIGGNFTIKARIGSFDSINHCFANLRGSLFNYSYTLTDSNNDGVYEANANTATIYDGNYTLIVTAVDSDGSTNSSSISVRIYTCPSTNIISPSNGQRVGGNFAVTATVTSIDEVSRCYATLRNSTHAITQNLTQASINGAYATSFETKTISDGEYVLSISALDVDGSQNSTQITVRVANTPTVEILVPSDGSVVYGGFNVTARISSYRTISSCIAIVRNSTMSRTFTLSHRGGGIFSGLVDSPLFSDGIYSLNVSVTDSLRSQGSARINVKIDNVPNVVILLPENDVFIQGNFTIRATVSSFNTLSRVVAIVDNIDRGNLTDPDADGVFDLVYDSRLLSEGSHTVYVKAFTTQGYYNSTSTHTIKVDNFASHIVINRPANGTSFQGAVVTVNSTIEDYVDWTRVYLNGIPVKYSTYNNAYVRTVEFEVDTSDIIFYTNTLVLTVRYQSALGHTDSAYHIIHKQ